MRLQAVKILVHRRVSGLVRSFRPPHHPGLGTYRCDLRHPGWWDRFFSWRGHRSRLKRKQALVHRWGSYQRKETCHLDSLGMAPRRGCSNLMQTRLKVLGSCMSHATRLRWDGRHKDQEARSGYRLVRTCQLKKIVLMGFYGIEVVADCNWGVPREEIQW
jgi:hypothetical protein